MDDATLPPNPLSLLARLYRERRSGVLSIGPGGRELWVLLREGQVAGLGPTAGPVSFSVPAPSRPDDSARKRLERVLAELGLRPSPPASTPSSAPAPRDLRARLLEALADGSLTALFEEGAQAPSDLAETAGATEPLILEAVRLMRDVGAVRAALGDLDQRLVVTSALADERTLTLTEGYLLSRIDGATSARQVLQLVPLDSDETERTLLGLVLTGRVEYGKAPSSRLAQKPGVAARPRVPEEPAEPATAPREPEAGHPDEAFPQDPSIEIEVPSPEPEAQPEAARAAPPPATQRLPPPELDRETLERRKEILEIFQGLPMKNHFEMLGVEPGCSDADVKRAYSSLAKRFHPDVNRDPRIEDLRDILEAIFIRVGEAWEVLGDAKSRASYEARFGVVRRARDAAPAHSNPPSTTRPDLARRPERAVSRSRSPRRT